MTADRLLVVGAIVAALAWLVSADDLEDMIPHDLPGLAPRSQLSTPVPGTRPTSRTLEDPVAFGGHEIEREEADLLRGTNDRPGPSPTDEVETVGGTVTARQRDILAGRL